jgi:2-amino-4-hydroxy-6-hydroxymethyldihydropteridine diphosphokinase
MTEWAFVALGSNAGDREEFLRRGRKWLRSLDNTTMAAKSSIEETDPIGPVPQQKFLNQMVLLRTELTPEEILQACHEGEQLAGRTRDEKWGPRTLDLDLVRFGDRRIESPELVVPHPQLANRAFWLRELVELLPSSWGRHDECLPRWAQVRRKRKAHIERVAALTATWAIAMRVTPEERRRWLRAAFLHDAVKDAPSEFLAEVSGGELSLPSLYHGPAAANLARDRGELDQGILDAVRYHSVGYAGWDRVGRMLYLADYLEPGRSAYSTERSKLSAAVPRDPDGTLRVVAEARMSWLTRKQLPVSREGLEFWKSIAGAG